MEKEIINEKILDLIFNSMVAEGGDGSATWFSSTPLNELKHSIYDYINRNDLRWELKIEDNYLSWGDNQEWCLITNDENIFNAHSKYDILTIKY
jgi:hypothetical protein